MEPEGEKKDTLVSLVRGTWQLFLSTREGLRTDMLQQRTIHWRVELRDNHATVDFSLSPRFSPPALSSLLSIDWKLDEKDGDGNSRRDNYFLLTAPVNIPRITGPNVTLSIFFSHFNIWNELSLFPSIAESGGKQSKITERMEARPANATFRWHWSICTEKVEAWQPEIWSWDSCVAFKKIKNRIGEHKFFLKEDPLFEKRWNPPSTLRQQ